MGKIDYQKDYIQIGNEKFVPMISEEKIAENNKFPAAHKIKKIGIEQLLKA